MIPAKRQKMCDIKFEEMPDEILLKIFLNLSTKEIFYCAQMSKRLRKICYDESLWQQINLYRSKVPIEFLEQILTSGCKYLSLSCTEIMKNSNELTVFREYGTNSQLKYLDLSRCTINKNHLVNLLWSCQFLEKLSLDRLTLDLDILGKMWQRVCT